MKKYCLEDERLLWVDEENLTKTSVVPGVFFSEHQRFFSGQTQNGGIDTLAIRLKNGGLEVKRNALLLRDIKDVGIVYQCGDDYFLWLYDDEVDTPLGSWLEDKFFFLRKEGDKKIVFNSIENIEFEYLSLTMDSGYRKVFSVGGGRLRIFKRQGTEFKKEHLVLDFSEDALIFCHRQEDGTYLPVSTVRDYVRALDNAYLATAGPNLELRALKNGKFEVLDTAPKDDWILGSSFISSHDFTWLVRDGEDELNLLPMKRKH